MGGLRSEQETGKPAAAPLDRRVLLFFDRSTIWEALLRVTAAALQILATWAVVRALSPVAAGVYFRGFVIAYGMAALLRANYELYMAYHIIGKRSAVTGVGDAVLLMQLGRRVLLRSSLVCGVLLVIAADIDIQAPRLLPVLETYLPFVLAIPCVSLFSFVGEALRAANRTLFGTIVSAYVLNLSILLAVALVPPDAPLALYAWAFFGGSIVAAVLALVLALAALHIDWAQGDAPITQDVLRSADERGIIGLGRAVLLWGPLCILAVAASAPEMAYYAAAARTAMIVDFFLPALNLSGGRGLSGDTSAIEMPRRLLLTQLVGSLLYSSIFIAVPLIAAPETLRLYGHPYESQLSVYLILLTVQWANSVARPALRYLVARWDVRRIRAAVGTAAAAALLVCGLTISSYGSLAPALASLVGASIMNLWAIADALWLQEMSNEEGARHMSGTGP